MNRAAWQLLLVPRDVSPHQAHQRKQGCASKQNKTRLCLAEVANSSFSQSLFQFNCHDCNRTKTSTMIDQHKDMLKLVSAIFYSVIIVLRQREQILSIHSEQSLCCIQNSQKSQAIRHIRYKVKSAVQCNPSIVNLFVRAKLSTVKGLRICVLRL